jgi:hypothetical protein
LDGIELSGGDLTAGLMVNDVGAVGGEELAPGIQNIIAFVWSMTSGPRELSARSALYVLPDLSIKSPQDICSREIRGDRVIGNLQNLIDTGNLGPTPAKD